MVLTPRLVALGVGAPLHPYYKSIIEWYRVAPAQLSPNSFKLAAALFILYHDKGFNSPTMEEFSYFFSIRKSNKGYFYFVVNKKHNKKEFSEGKVSNTKNWKEPFFYVWDIERIKVVFNPNPFKRVQNELFGNSLIRAQSILELSPENFDLQTLVTEENLKRVGLLSKEVGSITPFQYFRNGVPIKNATNIDDTEKDDDAIDEGASLSHDMAPKLPRGFGAAKKDKILETSAEDRARPDSKLDSSRKSAILVPESSHKRNRVEIKDPNRPLSKKQKKDEGAPSLVESQLGSLAAKFIKEKDLKAWQSISPEEENQATIQASAQLLLHSLGRAQKIHKEKLYISKLEAERKKFEETIVENDNKWKKDLDAAQADLAIVKAELKESFEHRDLLNDLNDKLKKEKEDLQIRVDTLEIEKLDWSKEQQALEDKNFQAGFEFYLLGFIANDPDYDWEKKFGAGPTEDMADFKIKNAEKIKLKRIELGLEEAVEDAPPSERTINPEETEDQGVQSTLNSTNPEQTLILEQVTSDVGNTSATKGASLDDIQGVP